MPLSALIPAPVKTTILIFFIYDLTIYNLLFIYDLTNVQFSNVQFTIDVQFGNLAIYMAVVTLILHSSLFPLQFVYCSTNIAKNTMQECGRTEKRYEKRRKAESTTHKTGEESRIDAKLLVYRLPFISVSFAIY